MIKFFRQSYAIQYVVIALMAIALWIPAFLSGQAITGLESPVTPLFNLVNRLLGFSVIAQYAFAFLLIVLEALLFNAVLVNNQITGKVGTMAAFVFVLLMSLTCSTTMPVPTSGRSGSSASTSSPSGKATCTRRLSSTLRRGISSMWVTAREPMRWTGSGGVSRNGR